MTDTNLIEIFCIFDNFCKYFTLELKNIRFKYLTSSFVPMFHPTLQHHCNSFAATEHRFPLSSIFNKKGAKPDKRFRSCTCFMMFYGL
ncbi:MAG: hypothetical protein ACTTI1_05630, partial [Prevotella intermedia]